MEKTEIQIQQDYLLGLFKQYVLDLKGQTLENEEGMPEEYISKQDVADGVIKVLNSWGSSHAKEND